VAKRRKGNFSEKEGTVIANEARGRNGGFIPILCPTESYRHMTGIRLGKVSSEVFCKNPERRRELGLPSIFVDP
jgi:hypothetical protein